MFSPSTSIRKKVLAAVEAKIDQRQKALDAEIKNLEEQLEKDKLNAVNRAVEEILSKVNL